MRTSTDIRFALDATTSRLDGARRMLGLGHPFDLSDLTGRVQEICGAIEGLPAPERHGFEPPMVALIDELNKLAEALTRQRDGLARGLKSISAGEQASKAYEQATKAPRK